MDYSIIKERLSYSLASYLHEKMRNTLWCEDGTYESNIKLHKTLYGL